MPALPTGAAPPAPAAAPIVEQPWLSVARIRFGACEPAGSPEWLERRGIGWRVVWRGTCSEG